MVQETSKSNSKKNGTSKEKKEVSALKIAIYAAIIGLIATILGSIIGIIPNIFKSSPPEFRLVKKIVHPDSAIVVKAVNRGAKKQKPLILEIDEYLFYGKEEPLEVDGNVIWKISLFELELAENVRCDGDHSIRFGFSQNKLSPKQKICFDSKTPQAFVEYASEFPNEKRISGRIVDESPMQDQDISVEVAFRHQEKLYTERLPVKSYTDANGKKMFEFEYHVQNIPQIPKDDPDYLQPFFALKVKDEAGNEIRHESTYSVFIAEGVQTFQTTSAQILLQKIDDEKVPVLTENIQPLEKIEPKRNIASGPPLITLRVLIRTPNFVRVSWNRLPENLRSEPEEYIMIRQNQSLGTSFDTTFSDRSISPDSAYQYQVLARGRDNNYYQSNVLPLPSSKEEIRKPLRSTATSLSLDQVKSMLKDKNLFDISLNQEGEGFENQFEASDFDGDRVVIDRASNLMWQQSGSPNYINYESAKKYIDELNNKAFAGYKDWRLPTLEEAMSLMDPEKKNKDLYIDPVFDARQTWIWTTDIFQGESRAAWVVGFLGGSCGWYGFDDGSCVRAVRSRQLSTE